MKNNLNKKEKRKALSPLIATILLIVVSVALIAMVVSWGKGFTTDNLTKSEKIKVYSESDVSFYINVVSSMNGRSVIDYKPPANSSFRDLNIIGYGIVGVTNHVAPFDSFIQVSPNHSANIDHGVILPEIDLLLYLSNDTVITKKKIRQEIKQPSSCPQGYTPVPGNHLYGTMNRDGGFCVAKWEMKVDQDGDGIGDTNATCKNTTNDIWENSKLDCNYNLYNRNVVSSSEGYTLTSITQNEAKDACVLAGGHLITNNEWMTIARNIELVGENWTGGEVGLGSLRLGNTYHSTRTCELGVQCYDGPYSDYGLENERNILARYVLTNNQHVWDLSGNVWDWVDNVINLDLNRPITYDGNDNVYLENNSFAYVKGDPLFSGNYINRENLGENSYLKYKDIFLLTNTDYKINQGHGYLGISPSVPENTAFLRGAGSTHGIFAGIGNLYLVHPPTLRHTIVGFRCVITP